jgi:hypothetical protein
MSFFYETKFRITWWGELKRRGYDVIPLIRDKISPYRGWPQMPNDEAAIRLWNGSGAATRMYRSDLLAIDLDMRVESARDRMLGWLVERHPEFVANCLHRHSQRTTLMLIGRCSTAKGTQRTSRYIGEKTDPKGDFVEVFTTNSKRYIGVAGTHSHRREYDYHGVHIVDTPADQLPWFPDSEIAPMLAAFEAIMGGLGWEKVIPTVGKDAIGTKVYDLEPDQIFTLADGSEIALEELEDWAKSGMTLGDHGAEQPLRGFANLWDSKTGSGQFSNTRVLVGFGAEGLSLFDTKYEVRHRWKSAAPQPDEIAENLREILKSVALPWRTQS